jgi:magnesium transporter
VVTIVDNAVYDKGRRIAQPDSLVGTYKLLRECDGLAWIGLYKPTEQEFSSLAVEFDLHPLAVEDAVHAHQRPKLERFGPVQFLVLRAARYLDTTEEVEFGEVHVFAGPDFVLTVRHCDMPDLRRVRRRMEADPDLLQQGTDAVLYAILDRVVDDYEPVVAGLENDIDEIEEQVFGGDPAVSQRIYQLSREVAEFQRATRPLAPVVEQLIAGSDAHGAAAELQRSFRDVHDHLVQVIDRIDGFRQLLQAALSVNATLVSQQQNEEMKRLTEVSLAQNEEVKKISAWAAILFAPTLIGTVYGMNFDIMPELDWAAGYPFALGLMILTCTAVYLAFKRAKWI